MLKQYEMVHLITEKSLKDAMTGKAVKIPVTAVGTIVEIYAVKSVSPSYEIEFTDSKGNAVVVTVKDKDVRACKKSSEKGKLLELPKPGAKVLVLKPRKRKIAAKKAAAPAKKKTKATR